MASVVPKSIILVDDDLTTNFLNRLFINQLGYDIDVHVAINGKEALELLSVMQHAHGSSSNFGPCLIILDLHMPVMDGWEFLESYNNQFDKDLKENVSIVVLCALGGSGEEKKALANPNVTTCAKKPLSDIDINYFLKELF